MLKYCEGVNIMSTESKGGIKIFKELIENKRVVYKESAEDWKEAISMASEPLLEQNLIEEEYIKAMIDSVEEHGPYIVIAPNIAIPHAKKEGAVNKTSMSFMRLKEAVNFGNKPEHKAKLIFVLASTDNESHLSLLENMVTKLSDQEIVDQLLKSENIEDLKKIFDF